MKKVNIGEIIRHRLIEDGRSINWLAEKIECDQSNLCKILAHTSISTELLEKISIALKHNFFNYYKFDFENIL